MGGGMGGGMRPLPYDRAPPARGGGSGCYRCGSPSHFARDCRGGAGGGASGGGGAVAGGYSSRRRRYNADGIQCISLRNKLSRHTVLHCSDNLCTSYYMLCRFSKLLSVQIFWPALISSVKCTWVQYCWSFNLSYTVQLCYSSLLSELSMRKL